MIAPMSVVDNSMMMVMCGLNDVVVMFDSDSPESLCMSGERSSRQNQNSKGHRRDNLFHLLTPVG